MKSRADLKNIIDLSLPSCEVGVAEGLNSFDILNWGVPKHYMVDTWRTVGETGDGASDQSWHDANFAKVQNLEVLFKERAVILRGLSSEMHDHVPDESLGFLYLDASHKYKDVMEDLKNWVPKVVRGGVVAGHDYLSPDYEVGLAVNSYCQLRGIKPITIPENGIWDASFYFIKP